MLLTNVCSPLQLYAKTAQLAWVSKIHAVMLLCALHHGWYASLVYAANGDD